ncbi:MAG TPA: LLM class F420-dependent oxidoreductase [Solirubrobacteraceae bacterium]|jgi:F420-dependent oxidoreductase-like protein|nr:LLM class F420-dependent oxidoreductase [Solirubrobacteraceae bacterium]
MGGELKLGLNTGYWAGGPPPGIAESVAEAERLGFDSMWTAEAYGSDCLTPLAWWGAATERIKLGTAIVQMSARQPAATAMAAMSMDHLSGGRFILGLGVSGPQVVEGWYGMPFAKPLARTREYIGILREVWARKGPVTAPGPHYPLPLPDGTGLAKPLKSSIHPLREDIPIYLGCEGPKNIALCAELCDGWLAMLFSPAAYDELYRPSLEEGWAKPGARRGAGDFEVCATVPLILSDDLDGAADALRPYYALYFGGMGAKGKNFHANVPIRMGYEREVAEIQELYLSGRKDEACAKVPKALIEELSLIGPREKIRDELARWRESVVTTLLIGGDAATLRAAAELVLG